MDEDTSIKEVQPMDCTSIKEVQPMDCTSIKEVQPMDCASGETLSSSYSIRTRSSFHDGLYGKVNLPLSKNKPEKTCSETEVIDRKCENVCKPLSIVLERLPIDFETSLKKIPTVPSGSFEKVSGYPYRRGYRKDLDVSPVGKSSEVNIETYLDSSQVVLKELFVILERLPEDLENFCKKK